MICSKCQHENSDIRYCSYCGAPLLRSELPVGFAFVCDKKFEELEGSDNFRRFCNSCKFDVINIDPLDAAARLKLFTESQALGKKLCISATMPVEQAKPCSKGVPPIGVPPIPKPPPRPTAGLPRRIEPTDLQKEYQRISNTTDSKADLLNSSCKIKVENEPPSLLSRLKSLLGL